MKPLERLARHQVAAPLLRGAAALADEPALPSVARIDHALAPLAGVRFVPSRPRGRRRRTLDPSAMYDAAIVLRGEVPTREQNLHDLLNALVWSAFPRAKRALHQRQYALLRDHMTRHEGALPAARSREHDQLAMVDEGGILLLAADPERAAACAEGFDVEGLGQLEAERRLRVVVFGHALFQELLEPKVRQIWGRTVVVQSACPWSLALAEVDMMLASAIGDPAKVGEHAAAGSALLRSSVPC